MKNLLTAILLLSAICINAQSYVDYHGQLGIDGSKVINQWNEHVGFMGPSLFWSNTDWGGEDFYNDAIVYDVANIWGAPIIRAAMGVDAPGGYLEDASNKTRVEAVIDAAIDEGIYVIIDWHSHHAEDYQSDAITFFKAMATKYGNYPNVIYEIYNEPLNVPWSTKIKPYATSVISAIRKIDPDNIIVVGTRNWCQEIKEAADNPITGYNNIAYAVHFYAGTHKQWLIDNTQYALDKGIPVIITEWGTVNSSGDGAVDEASVDAWLTFMKENNIINCNWSLNDKAEGASILVTGASDVGDWEATDFTESGKLVVDLIENWEGNYVSIESTDLNNNIGIIQNPRNEVLIISSGKTIESYCLYDINGRLLQTNTTTTFSLSGFREGIYILTVNTENKTSSFKLIK